eukprot:scaffold1719_cov40-Cyclotella_meneghiniana.AAC.1
MERHSKNDWDEKENREDLSFLEVEKDIWKEQFPHCVQELEEGEEGEDSSSEDESEEEEDEEVISLADDLDGESSSESSSSINDS